MTKGENMKNFSNILQHMSIEKFASLSRDHFGSTSPFKVEVNFDILIFEGQIEADALDKWLNLLKGYFSFHNFSDREKFTSILLKDLPMLNIGGKLIGSKLSERSMEYMWSSPLEIFFVDAVKEQYYHFGSYEDEYMRWAKLCQERGQVLS
jgi:hypothetical protein